MQTPAPSEASSNGATASAEGLEEEWNGFSDVDEVQNVAPDTSKRAKKRKKGRTG